MTPEAPFKIAVPDSELELLRKKLVLHRLPDELDGAGWDYGVPLANVRRLVEHWKDGYNWRKAEAALNRDLPMFTRDIEVSGHGTLSIHYVHKKSKTTGAVPLMFVHGWPGSFIEVRKILPMLVNPPGTSQGFHVVALSLPGYGFSEAPSMKGFGLEQMAEVAHKIMLALGYDNYIAQGGDWGSFITQIMASKYGPKHVIGWHTNMPFAPPPHPLRTPLRFFKFVFQSMKNEEHEDMARAREFQRTGNGYLKVQATKPQTIGYGLTDSPVGLLAWIYEKLIAWTDEYPWTDDEVLTWISIYWFSRGGPAAAARLYYESRPALKKLKSFKLKKQVHIGFSYYPKEMVKIPKAWTRHLGEIVFEKKREKGGHFAAYEVPELLASDLRSMVKDSNEHKMARK